MHLRFLVLLALVVCCSAGPILVLTSEKQGLFCIQEYVVQTGDTTASISAKYGITPYQFAASNYMTGKLNYDDLSNFVGKKVCVFAYVSPF